MNWYTLANTQYARLDAQWINGLTNAFAMASSPAGPFFNTRAQGLPDDLTKPFKLTYSTRGPQPYTVVVRINPVAEAMDFQVMKNMKLLGYDKVDSSTVPIHESALHLVNSAMAFVNNDFNTTSQQNFR